MTAADRPLTTLSQESERQLEALRRGIERAAGFSFHVVLARDLARVELLRRLRAWGAPEMPELRFFPEGEEGARAVDLFLAVRDERSAHAGAVIPDGAALLDAEGGEVLATLNVSRDVLGKLIRGPLLLVLPPEREGDLARGAADLFDVRAGTVVVQGEVAAADVQREAARLRAMELDDEPPLGALADAWVRLGNELLDAGEVREAKEAALAAQRLAERAGYEGGVADGRMLEARALARAGELDQAELAPEAAAGGGKTDRRRRR